MYTNSYISLQITTIYKHYFIHLLVRFYKSSTADVCLLGFSGKQIAIAENFGFIADRFSSVSLDSSFVSICVVVCVLKHGIFRIFFLEFLCLSFIFKMFMFL